MRLGTYFGDVDQHGPGDATTDSSGNLYGAATVNAAHAESSRYGTEEDAALSAFNIRNGELTVEWNGRALNDRLDAREQRDSHRSEQVSLTGEYGGGRPKELLNIIL